MNDAQRKAEAAWVRRGETVWALVCTRQDPDGVDADRVRVYLDEQEALAAAALLYDAELRDDPNAKGEHDTPSVWTTENGRDGVTCVWTVEAVTLQ